MSGFMPYVVEKGPYFSVLESKLAQPAARAQVLIDLKNNVALADLAGFDSTNLGTPAPSKSGDGLDRAGRKKHLNEDWFGFGQPSFWVDYEGNPELILRQAMIRTIEMSFGLEHGEPAPEPGQAANRRHWPIDIYWICQGPWFQCWVLWRRSTGDEGHVTLLLTTPPAYGYPLTSKITRPDDPTLGTEEQYTADNHNYRHPPEHLAPSPPTGLEKGMWVIGHEDYERDIVFSTKRDEIGKIVIPSLGWKAVDPSTVECVAPAEWEGGVLETPRPYVP